MSTQDMEAVLKFGIFTPYDRRRYNGKTVTYWGQNLVFSGLPGIAKSGLIVQFCHRWGLAALELPPGEMGEGAFGVTGVPIGNGQDMRLFFPPPSDVDAFDPVDGSTNGRGLVFLDEVVDASRAQRPAIQAFFHARRWGGYKFGPGVRVMGACNPPDISANGSKMSVPMANRIFHYTWEAPTAQERADYRLAMWQSGTGDAEIESPNNAAAEEKRVLAAWPQEIADAIAMTSAFHLRCEAENVLHKMPNPKSAAVTGPWASHRSWDMAENALAGGKIHGLSDVLIDRLIAAAIGEETTAKFAEFRANLDIPDAFRWLDGQEKFTHDKNRLDRTFVLLRQAAARLSNPSCDKRNERAESMWGKMGEIGSAELLESPCTSLIAAGLIQSAPAMKVLAKLRPVLEASGLRASPKR
jgi:hypothetical protein